MDETRSLDGSSEKEERDARGFQENPAVQGLKTPPPLEKGEDSGEWTRGGGSDPNEVEAAAQRKSSTP